MSDANPVSDLFSEEIDAFGGTINDIQAYLKGQPVHTDAAKWAKRAITIATTVLPMGLGAKAAVKGAKATAKGLSASAHLTRAGRQTAHAAKAEEIDKLRKQQQKLKQYQHTAKDVGGVVKDSTRVVYHATGDADARQRRNRAALSAYDIATTYSNPNEVKNMATRKKSIISQKMKKDALGGAADAAIKQLSKRQYAKKPMNQDDLKILGAQLALGALKGARGTKKSKFQGFNDKRWYTKLGTDMVGLNFSAVDKLGYRQDVLQDAQGTPLGLRVSTDAYINLMLTIPNQADDPFTVASAKLANEMRLHSGANTIYSPADVMEYLINARAIMAAICQVRRALMSFNNADPTDVDAYKKYTLIAIDSFTTATGGKYAAARADLANLLTDMNAVIKAVHMMIPINMPIMKRTEWLFTNAFADGKTAKYSTKMFIASYLPSAYVDPSTEDVVIEQHEFLYTKDLRAALAELRARVNAFVVAQKHMAIAGDIMKVYGQEAFWTPSLLDGTEPMPIIYDEEALTQIQNMTVINSPGVDLDIANVTQRIHNGVTTGSLPFNKVAGRSAGFINDRAYPIYRRKVVQTYKPHPDGGDILELTRLVTHLNYVATDDANPVCTDFVCGTEIAVDYGYITERVENTGDDHVVGYPLRDTGNSTNDVCAFAACWSIDDWGPFCIIGASGAQSLIFALFDFETWAAIAQPQIASFHYIAGVSLYTNEIPVLKPTI